MSRLPPIKPSFYVVGCGALGTALAQALVNAGYPLVGAMNRGARRRRNFSKLLGIPVSTQLDARLGQAGLILLTVTDQALPEMALALGRTGFCRPQSVVLHTSGVLPGAALGLKAQTGSLHPLAAVPTRGPPDLCATTFAIEGTKAARRAMRRLVCALGGTAFTLQARHKARYHAGCVLASNLSVALWYQAAQLLKEAKVPAAHRVTLALTHSAWQAVATLGFRHGLTGPLKRNDLATLERHMAALPKDVRELYRRLSLMALPLAPGSRLALRTLLQAPRPTHSRRRS